MYESLLERLDRIEEKIDQKLLIRYLDISKVCQMTSISDSTIRRAIRKGVLKCSKKTGKLLFQEKDIMRWLND